MKVTVPSSPDVPAGTYHVLAEVTSPDGHTARADAPTTLEVTPLAGTVRSPAAGPLAVDPVG